MPKIILPTAFNIFIERQCNLYYGGLMETTPMVSKEFYYNPIGF